MCIFKSYFEKNNTIVFNSDINTSKNQVTDIVYGGNPNVFSRFIFKVNLDDLINKIIEQEITEDKILLHKLKIFNTINTLDKYIGQYIDNSQTRQRASSFKLLIFKINEEWDEGSGYDISFKKDFLNNPKNKSASNWYEKKKTENWDIPGIYDEESVDIISVIDFDNGDENIDIDITEYINDIIYNGEPNNGLGIAFTEEFEEINDSKLYSVSFHTKYTSTVFEPFVESHFDMVISDDRNNFKLDEVNRLYFYAKRGQNFLDIILHEVRIYNYKFQLIDVIKPDNIFKHSKGIYYIELQLNSDENIDSVLYTDEWIFDLNDELKSIQNEFYLNENEVNTFVLSSLPKNTINVTFSGILNKQKIKRGESIIIDLLMKKLYHNNDNSYPYDLEYRIYIPQSNKTEFEVIPLTKVNRAPNKYFIMLDTSFFIPSIYRMELKIKNIDYTLNYEEIEFVIVD
jgi:hypothetical protein